MTHAGRRTNVNIQIICTGHTKIELKRLLVCIAFMFPKRLLLLHMAYFPFSLVLWRRQTSQNVG